LTLASAIDTLAQKGGAAHFLSQPAVP